jgi:hypothetical protein
VSDGNQQGDAASPEPDRELVFYYNRERRMERASPEVRAMNEGTPLIRGGLVRSLTSTKPHLILFVSIVMILLWILIFSGISGSRGSLAIGGVTLRFSAGGGAEPFILVKKTIAGGGEPYTGVVYVGVTPFLKSPGNRDPADIPVFTDQLFFTLEREEEYRLALPFGAESYLLLFQAGEQQASIRVRAAR